MRTLLQDGIDSFNSGAYYQAHESWEDLWRETTGDARLFYQGLVQAAVGLHHISRSNRRGGRNVLERGLKKLSMYPPTYAGIDNDGLRRDLESVLAGAGVREIRIRLPDSTPGE